MSELFFFEGGRHSKSAIAAATKYVEKAMAMGGSWLSYNAMTERTDVLYVKKTHKQVFQQKWALFVESQQDAAPLYK